MCVTSDRDGRHPTAPERVGCVDGGKAVVTHPYPDEEWARPCPFA
ncbi:hypothetical protein HNQ79_000926 [Streptomyces candidus]|uniref:Uncharacterized protein n=1 Tax=Streptomyces candidus TaxID=67283 RepID=A0A7X0HBA9_9ACTN|nr:hypothetical protein [Streptomyces candidus]